MRLTELITKTGVSEHKHIHISETTKHSNLRLGVFAS